MTKSQLGLLGSLFAAGALAMVGCGGGSSGGTGGTTGTGGKGGGGGTTTGTGGHGGATAVGGAGGGAPDAGSDVHTGAGGAGTGGSDAGGDAGPIDATACTTSFGAGNRVLFAFDNGSTTGWESVGSDPADSGLTLSVGGTTTDGVACPGAAVLTAPFTVYGGAGNTEQAQIDYQFFNNGGPLSYVGYSKLHMSVKVVTTAYGALAAIQPFAGLVSNATPATYPYLGQYTGGINSAAWREFIIDLSGYSSADFKIGNLGAQVQLQGTAPGGGPAAPTTIQLLIDDVWLEAAPAVTDAGTDATTDVPVDTGTDVPAVDTGVDVAPTDTGVSDTAADATPG
jgi:hypothetical protein